MRCATPLVVGALVSLTAGCTGRTELTPAARKQLDAARRAYDRGRDREVVERIDAFLRDHGRSAAADQAYYYRGRARCRLGQADTARHDLRQAIARTEDENLRGSAMIVLGDIAFDASATPEAVQWYRQALEHLAPGAKPGDYALFRLGCSLQRQGQWADADRQFDRLDHLFGGGRLAALAARKVRATAWTVQAGAYAERSNAAAAAAALRRDDLPAVVRPVSRGGRPLFAVQAGRFDTYDAAAETLRAVQRRRGDAFATVTR
jgi:tetratricopeptide (TPR) repeat protein